MKEYKTPIAIIIGAIIIALAIFLPSYLHKKKAYELCMEDPAYYPNKEYHCYYLINIRGK